MCAATKSQCPHLPKSHKIQHLAIRNTKFTLQIGFSILISFHFSTIFFPVSNIIKILFKCNIKKTLNGREVVLFLLGFGFLIFATCKQHMILFNSLYNCNINYILCIDFAIFSFNILYLILSISQAIIPFICE